MQTKPAIFFLTVFLIVLLFLPLIHPAFATTIFSDGFESGDFSAWTGVTGEPTIVTSPVYYGSYAMLADAVNEFVYKNFTSQTITFVRLYFQCSALGNTLGGTSLLRLETTGNLIYKVSIRSSYIDLYEAYDSSWHSTAYTFNNNQWYCLEVKFVKATLGEYRIYIDGTEVYSHTNIDTSGIDYAVRIKVGRDPYSSTNTKVYIDCVVVADTYIGPETAAQEYSFTLTETVKPTSTLNIQQEHSYTFTGTVIQSSILEYGAEAMQTLTQTITSTETRIILQEQLYTFPQTTTLRTTLTYAGELAEAFITNIETITPHEIITYWIESPIDWSIVAIGLAAVAFIIAAAAIATR